MTYSTPTRGHGKERLIQAALTLFGQQGVDGTTVRDVVSHAGVSLGLIRTHFGSKQGLQEATNEYVFQQLEGIYTAAAAGGTTASLDDLTRGQWGLENNAPKIMAYLRQVISKPEQSADLFERLYQHIYAFVIRANQNGDIQAGPDLRWSAFTIMSLLLGPLIMEPYSKKIIGDSMFSETSLLERNKTYRQIFAHGLFVQPAAPDYEH